MRVVHRSHLTRSSGILAEKERHGETGDGVEEAAGSRQMRGDRCGGWCGGPAISGHPAEVWGSFLHKPHRPVAPLIGKMQQINPTSQVGNVDGGLR